MAVGLDHLIGLESSLPHGPPKDVLYICSKEKNYFAELQKDSWCSRFNWDSDFPAVTALSSSRGVTGLMIRYSGALQTPSVLNVFAAEEPVKLSILHIPSPNPTNAWEATVLVLRC